MEREVSDGNGVCPECDRWLGKWTTPYHPGVHKKDCELGIMVSDDCIGP